MGTNWESSTSIYTPPRVNQLAGSCCRAQGAQPVRFDDLGGWHGGRRVGRRFKWEGIDAYICFTMLHSRNEDNIVKQLYSNKKI